MRVPFAAVTLALFLGIVGIPYENCNAATVTVVLAESLKVLDAPNGRAIGTLTQGEAISVYELRGEWARSRGLAPAQAI